MSSHDALTLLKASFSAPKVLHTLRSSPCVGHLALDQFDALLRSALCNITNSILSDIQWLQASLPVRDGGLGVRRVALLASSAFLASAASTTTFRNKSLSGVTPAQLLLLNQPAASGPPLTIFLAPALHFHQNRRPGIHHSLK